MIIYSLFTFICLLLQSYFSCPYYSMIIYSLFTFICLLPQSYFSCLYYSIIDYTLFTFVFLCYTCILMFHMLRYGFLYFIYLYDFISVLYFTIPQRYTKRTNALMLMRNDKVLSSNSQCWCVMIKY